MVFEDDKNKKIWQECEGAPVLLYASKFIYQFVLTAPNPRYTNTNKEEEEMKKKTRNVLFNVNYV
jgi:hypothetical protein